MIKPVKLLLAIIMCFAPLLPAGAEVDLFDIQAALLLGETTVKVPAEAQEADLPAIASCIKGAKGITLDLSATKIKVISDSAFSWCESLSSVTIPAGVTSIGAYAFWECKSLTLIKIPDSVTSIGAYAFLECESLSSLTIPAGVTNIGASAFRGCTALANKDGFVIVCGILFDYTGNAQKVVIPSSVTSIGEQAFYGCKSLSSVTIPASVTSIGDEAFSGCTALADKDRFVIVRSILFDYTGNARNVVIPAGVTSIGRSAFHGCKSLTSITIPDSVTSIGKEAFYGCTSLTSITFESTGGWYLDEALTQSVGSGELASRVKAGKALYKKGR